MDWIKNKRLKRDWFGAFPKISLYWILGWLASVSTFLLSLLIGSFFDLQWSGLSGKGILLERFGIQFGELDTFFLVMSLVLVTKLMIQYVERKGINQDADRFVADLQQRLFRRQIRWNHDQFNQKPFSKYLLKYTGDLSSIRNMLVNGFHRGFRDLLFLLTGLGILFWINPIWSLLILSAGLLTFPLFLWIDKKQLGLVPTKRNQKNNLIHLITDSFSKHKELQDQKRINRTLKKFEAQNQNLLESNLSYQHLESLRHALVNGMGPFMILILLMTTTAGWTEVSTGSLLAFLLVLGSMVAPLRNLIKAPEIIEKGMLSLRKIDRTLRIKTNNPKLPADDVSGPLIPIQGRDQIKRL